MPNYAHIVPNQCNDMHGRDAGAGGAAGLPLNRTYRDSSARGDRVIAGLVRSIMDSPRLAERRTTSPSSSPSMKTTKTNAMARIRAVVALIRTVPPIPAAAISRPS